LTFEHGVDSQQFSGVAPGLVQDPNGHFLILRVFKNELVVDSSAVFVEGDLDGLTQVMGFQV
jgi:hypothetical protein